MFFLTIMSQRTRAVNWKTWGRIWVRGEALMRPWNWQSGWVTFIVRSAATVKLWMHIKLR